MALTFRPSASFIHLNESRAFTSLDDVPSLISFAQIKRSLRIQSKRSTQEPQLLHEKTFSFDEEQNKRSEILHVPSIIHGKNDSKVPVFVMLPLDTVTLGGHLHKPRAMNASLMALKSAGVEGVMVDVWWGLVEKEGPCKYNWEGYAELIQMVQRHGLKLQMVMSFHQCGGNVGDSCMEMRDHEQPQYANCSPEGLNHQVKMATKSAGTELAGENALERYDSGGYAQVIATSRADSGNRLSAFTYLHVRFIAVKMVKEQKEIVLV